LFRWHCFAIHRALPWHAPGKEEAHSFSLAEACTERDQLMTRFALRTLICLSLPFWLAGSLATAASGDPEAGKPLYERHCAGCHGVRGTGEGPVGQGLIPPAADLTGAKSKKKLDAVLSNMIEHGKPGTEMAAWKGRLAGREIADVVAYVKTLGRSAP
jgi:mono/diheme cytochrome c family protein